MAKSVVITGAGGSIGSAIVSRLGRENLDTLYLVGHGEDSIFQLINSPQAQGWNCSIVPIIADAGSEQVLGLIRKNKPQYVIHAAAHKHVGLMEINPSSAFENNVKQTLRLAEASQEAASKFIFISTDKAVNPTTVMGATKRIAESAIRAFYPDSTVVCRFGNVLGSAGSILEIARQKKSRREKLIIYNGMKRHFITAREAVGLVLSSSPSIGTFVLEMGEPLDIFELIKDFGFPESLIERAPAPFKAEKSEEDIWGNRIKIELSKMTGVARVRSRHYPALIRAAIEEAEVAVQGSNYSEVLVDLANRV